MDRAICIAVPSDPLHLLVELAIQKLDRKYILMLRYTHSSLVLVEVAMSEEAPSNAVILLGSGIMGWGLKIKGKLPISGKLVDGTPPMECPYQYQFPEGRCPYLGSSVHDRSAPMRFLEFDGPFTMGPAEPKEEGQYQIRVSAQDTVFYLRAVLGKEHRHITLFVVPSPT